MEAAAPDALRKILATFPKGRVACLGGPQAELGAGDTTPTGPVDSPEAKAKAPEVQHAAKQQPAYPDARQRAHRRENVDEQRAFGIFQRLQVLRLLVWRHPLE